MAQISLRTITNRLPGDGREIPSHRQLGYQLGPVSPRNPWWWVLRVTIPVEFHFVPADSWALRTGRRVEFPDLFASHVRRTWSNRWLVVTDRIDDARDVVRIEVRVEISQYPGHDDETWHVVVYPQDMLRDEEHGTRCVYELRRNQLNDSPATPASLLDKAVCFVDEQDARCLPSRQNRRFRQRPIDHEVGHMLGMVHVSCNANRDACYGSTDAERERILGLGNAVTRDDYAWALNLVRAVHRPRRSWYLGTERSSMTGRPTCR
jgi:hypothetical protein